MGNKKDSLGDRMKEYYESVSKTRLTKRIPVIIRIDGKAFHTFTKGFNKPYDVVLSNAMVKTMEYLCSNIQGCVFGYTQSDEITLVLVDYKTLTTSAWFDYQVQKVCSVAASMATACFNKVFAEEAERFHGSMLDDEIHYFMRKYRISDKSESMGFYEKYLKAIAKTAMFDARCFNIPKEEVCNCLIWRQQDASRNSVEMLGRAFFSDKELFKKNCSEIQDMLMDTHQVNWNDVETRFKRGCCCYKDMDGDHSFWNIDFDMPVLTQDRNYVEKHVFIGE